MLGRRFCCSASAFNSFTSAFLVLSLASYSAMPACKRQLKARNLVALCASPEPYPSPSMQDSRLPFSREAPTSLPPCLHRGLALGVVWCGESSQRGQCK